MRMQFYFVLCTTCNLHCSHCIRKYSSDYTNIKITKEDIVRIITQTKNKEDFDIIPILTGGEPTLSEFYFEILDYLTQEFTTVYTCSNGVLDDNTINNLTKYKNNIIQISLDGNSETHNKIRGKDTFERAIGTIERLIMQGIEVSVSSTVNRQNLDSMFDLANRLSLLNICSWKVSLEQNFENYSESLTIEKWNTFVDDLIHFAHVPIKIKKLFDFQLFEKMEQKIGKEKLKKIANPNCGFCNSKCYIYPDLSVRGCTCIKDIILGNFNEDTFDQILEKMAFYKNKCCIDISSPCYLCKWKYLCNGGCPGYSYHYKGRLGLGDIRCPIVRGNKNV